MSQPPNPAPRPPAQSGPVPSGDLLGGSGIDANLPHRPTADTEEVYYEGSPSLKAELGLFIGLGLGGLILLVLTTWAAIHWGGKVWLLPLLAVVAIAATFAIRVFITRSTRYKITNYRIDFEHGLLTKTIDTLELWHVEDPRFHQTLLNRMLGIGTITIISNDPTTPTLIMRGLPNPRPLFDALKQRIISVKRSRGVLKLDA